MTADDAVARASRAPRAPVPRCRPRRPSTSRRESTLVAAALAAADARVVTPIHRGRSHRVWQAVAGVAAAAAVIVGVVAVAGTNRAGESKSSSMNEVAAGKATGTTQPAARVPRALIEFGDVTGNDSLQTRVRAEGGDLERARGRAATEQSPLATSAGGTAAHGELRRRRFRESPRPPARDPAVREPARAVRESRRRAGPGRHRNLRATAPSTSRCSRAGTAGWPTSCPPPTARWSPARPCPDIGRPVRPRPAGSRPCTLPRRDHAGTRT